MMCHCEIILASLTFCYFFALIMMLLLVSCFLKALVYVCVFYVPVSVCVCIDFVVLIG